MTTNTERQYFIVSIGHNQRSDKYIRMFGANDSGYYGRIKSAGRYPESHVKTKLRYYNDGVCNIAVPCDVMESLSEPVEPKFFDDDSGCWVRNNRKNWQVLLQNVIEKPGYEPAPLYHGAPWGDYE